MTFTPIKFLLVVLGSLFAACSNKPIVPLDTVTNVDLNRYTGKWYEIALVPNEFQSMCVADTQANYRADGDVIRVTNRCRKNDGSLAEVNGVAKIVEGSGNAKLRVSFFRPFYGDYWVLALDPEYKWVLVGEPRRKFGWVLSRSPKLSERELNMALETASQLGYARGQFQFTPQTQPLD